eukprot:TRINITY_DN2481_c0_g1_i10.p2 TRINITY_DN2481_c0_g1~~TRINITY_DN2481_c0_g1_i10.p2  ORF type:complete len:261 (-),score=47.98 TRINITY_DN2481_c0_g1_i10:7-789(-)
MRKPTKTALHKWYNSLISVTTFMVRARQGSENFLPLWMPHDHIHCFEELVFSEFQRPSVAAYTLQDTRTMIHTFRRAAFEWARVPLPVPVAPAPGRCIRRAWIYAKFDSEHKAFLNFREVAQWLRDNTPLEVEAMHQFPRLTVMEQIRYFSEFELFISPMGAHELYTLFIPSHAQVISLPSGGQWLEYALHPGLDFTIFSPQSDVPESLEQGLLDKLAADGLRPGNGYQTPVRMNQLMSLDTLAEIYNVLKAQNLICGLR